MTHNEAQIEDDKDYKTVLESSFTIPQEVLQAESCKEQEVVDEVSDEVEQLFSHIIATQFFIL